MAKVKAHVEVQIRTDAGNDAKVQDYADVFSLVQLKSRLAQACQLLDHHLLNYLH